MSGARIGADLESVVVEHRPLTRSEAHLVVEEIRSSTTITGYSLEEWCGRRETFVALDRRSGDVVGAALVHAFLGGWSEVAVLFVRETHRGRGIGPRLLSEIIEQLHGRRLLLFFCEDTMRRMVLRHGFTVHRTPHDLPGRPLLRRLFLSVLYPLQWKADSYRRREIRRKRARYGCSFDFTLSSLTSSDQRPRKDFS
ncbi:GNAT family N-acetyltransferase [Rathayibacter sp. SD072]|uniref:GNAT family N-acetyltransferase n=1 Tax=Rathayibacter sp. SD072 TaxID=2781731 RepID=UPI001A970B35|nr:GNAT family N-acetyltransferase [Rathayibacter sp. SD072]MBO0982462.1 GNAT family N-acetyltransferase [Rathayibacter sp. SD072]